MHPRKIVLWKPSSNYFCFYFQTGKVWGGGRASGCRNSSHRIFELKETISGFDPSESLC